MTLNKIKVKEEVVFWLTAMQYTADPILSSPLLSALQEANNLLPLFDTEHGGQ